MTCEDSAFKIRLFCHVLVILQFNKYILKNYNWLRLCPAPLIQSKSAQLVAKRVTKICCFHCFYHLYPLSSAGFSIYVCGIFAYSHAILNPSPFIAAQRVK